MSRAATALLFLFLLLIPAPAFAADIFVAPGSTTGDGTREKPFNDPWRALAAAASGDSIHIAQGVYFGRYDRSAWTINRPKLTLLGGYDRDFKSRDPWKNPSVFAFYRDYEGSSENNLVTGNGDHADLTLDGLVFDGAGRGQYNPKPPHELLRSLQLIGPLLTLDAPNIKIRNCTFINSTAGGVELRGKNATFENNILINMEGPAMLALRDKPGADPKLPAIIRNNTFAFAYDAGDPPLGKGGERGAAVKPSAPALIENNLFAACGNAAIQVAGKPELVAICGNVFSFTLRAHVAARIDGREMLITDKNLDEMEDLGFKNTKDNSAADTSLTGLKSEWIDGVTRHLLLAYKTPPKDALNALRTKYDLKDPVAPAGDDVGPRAPLLEPADAAALRADTKAGAHPVELKVNFAAAAPAARAPNFTRIDWPQLNAGGAAIEGKPVELLVAIGNERNGFVKSGITAEEYLGFDVYGEGSRPDSYHVYAKRNGSVHNQWQETTKSSNARESEDWYLLRGIARTSNADMQKSTIEVLVILPAQAPAKPATPRPKGKEYFVRAGSVGGDGSREKPFRDPFQALEKAGEGDIIRIATGDYFGKLKTANWKIAAKYQTLLGGYDADFQSRDPWKNPTRLVLPADAAKKDKSDHAGHFIESSEICTGLVLDGLILDGSTANTYFAGGGALDLANSPANPMLNLQGLEITIRNCIFLNASGLAAQISAPTGALENNIFVNTSGSDVIISALGPGPWIIRNNTFLSTMDPLQRAGSGSASGTHLMVRGRAAMRIESNIFAFADNCAIISGVPRDKLVLEKNAFVASIYCHYTDSSRNWLYDKVWDRRLADSGISSTRDNTLSLPKNLPLDKTYIDNALTRLFKWNTYSRDDWSRIAAAVGAGVTPPEAEATSQPATKKSEEKKEQSLDDMMADLNKMKSDSARSSAPTTAPAGPPFAPIYPLKSAVDLARDPSTTIGARHIPLTD